MKDQYELGFDNGFESAKREFINAADQWLRVHLPRVMEYYLDENNKIDDMLNEDLRIDFREAMIKIK